MGLPGNSKKDMSGVKFRDIEFGTSPEEVKNSEEKELDSRVKGNIEHLEAEDNLKSHKFKLRYHFVNEKLAQGSYICAEEFVDESQYVSLYHDLYDMLEDKYGKPSEKNEVNNINEIYRTGLYGGANWEGEEKGVELHLKLEKNTLLLRIMYVNMDLNQKLIQEQENQTSEKL